MEWSRVAQNIRKKRLNTHNASYISLNDGNSWIVVLFTLKMKVDQQAMAHIEVKKNGRLSTLRFKSNNIFLAVYKSKRHKQIIRLRFEHKFVKTVWAHKQVRQIAPFYNKKVK